MYPLSVKPNSVPHSHAVNLLGPGLGFEPRKSVYATDVLPCIQFQSPCGGVESGRFVVIRTRPNLYCKNLMVEGRRFERRKSEPQNGALYPCTRAK